MISTSTLLIALGTLFTPSIDPSSSTSGTLQEQPLELTFGVYQTDKATTLYRKFTPTLERLQETMEEDMGRTVDIRLKIYKTYEGGISALATGEVDFVRFGPAPYVTAHARQPYVQLLAMEHKKGKKRFPGVIVVRADSELNSLEDLRGKSFAFGDENSTIGRYLSQAVLVKKGILQDDLGAVAYLGRHDKVALAVAIGDYDAGALKRSTLDKVDKEGRLRVLVEFENVTKPWVARAGLEPATVRSLSKALVGLADEEALEALGVSGFLETSDKEYAFVRDAMKRARSFERAKDKQTSEVEESRQAK